MSKVQYKFNTKTLKYEKIPVSAKKIILNFLFIFLGLIFAIGTVNFYFGKEILASSLAKNVVLIFTTITVLMTILFALLNYLNRWNINSKSSLVEKSLIKLQNKVDELSKDAPKVDEAKLYSYVKENLEKNVLKTLEAFSENVTLEKKKTEFFEDLFRSEDRLTMEISNTTRRANLNLVIGILSTIIGITAFGYIIYKTPDNQSLAMAYFLPRICLIIFTQIFSYFFLRLYKKGLEDTKYYHNELTNIESKISAIQYSINIIEDKELNGIIIKSMMRNDRNYPLPSDFTTGSIEMEKLNKNEGLNDVIELLKSVSRLEKN